MRGAIFSSSQLKWLCRDRLFLETSIDVCNFSYSGATVRTLRERIDILPLKKLKFVIVYIGGNDLQNGGRGSAVVQEVVELLLRLRQQAQYVFCFKLLPQRRNKAVDPELRYFNRALPRALKRNGDRNVISLTVDHKFLDHQRKLKTGLLAADGYHVSGGAGTAALAGILVGALSKAFGPWVKKHPGVLRTPFIWGCKVCQAKGHNAAH
ncbi:hypothetical protein ISCGN_007004 [Ixodes scapularis]